MVTVANFLVDDTLAARFWRVEQSLMYFYGNYSTSQSNNAIGGAKKSFGPVRTRFDGAFKATQLVFDDRGWAGFE